MAKKFEEVKNLWSTSLIRIQELLEDFEELMKRNCLQEDLKVVYGNLQTEKVVFDDLHKKYNLHVLDNEEESKHLKAVRDRLRPQFCTVSERYNERLERDEPTSSATATQTTDVINILKGLNVRSGKCDLEPLSCPKWDGKRLSYATFKKHFIEAMEKNGQDESRQLLRLRSAIHDKKWKRKVDTCSNIHNAWSILDREFVNDQKLVRDIYLEIDRFKLKNTPESLSDFASIIRESMQQFNDIGKFQETKCEVFIDKLRKKLDPEMLEKFCCHMCLKEKGETTENLAEWLEVMASIKDTRQVSESFKKPPSIPSRQHALRGSIRQNACPLDCANSHMLTICPKFQEMSVKERWHLIRKTKRCRNCLRQHHTTNCRQNSNCDKCGIHHHKLLHITEDSTRPKLNPNAEPFVRNTSGNVASNLGSLNMPYKSAQCPVQKVHITNASGKRVEALVLLDSGSDICLMSKRFAKENGFSGTQQTLNMLLAGGDRKTEISEHFSTTIAPINDPTLEKSIMVCTVNKPCSDAKTISKTALSKFKHLEPVLDDLHLRGGKIDILIGTEFSDAFIDLACKAGSTKQPIAKRNIFGWYVLGMVDEKTEFTAACNFVRGVKMEEFTEEKTKNDIKQLLYQDQLGIRPTKYCICDDQTLEENRFITIINESTKLIDGRVQVRMPWKDSGPPRKSNYDIALKRMKSTERSLINKGKLTAVNAEVEKLLNSNFITEIKQVDHSKPEFYLPMQVVFTPGKSTEIRLVFDSSARDHDGYSLNDRLEKGPNLINSLLEVLLAWRWDNVAYSGDIQKMFNQVLVHPDDQKYHRFIWRPSQNESPRIYQWLRLNFGNKPSPSIATNSINFLAKKLETTYPEAASELLRRAYVDDIAGSRPTMEEAKKITNEIDEILSQGQFKIKCWHLNQQLSTELKNELHTDLLGHSWNKVTDCFTYKKNTIVEKIELFNKRKCLASLAQVWDPIGLVVPVTITFRIHLQELWSAGYGWDDILPEDQQQRWRENLQMMNEVLNLSFDRKIKPDNAVGIPEIHGFCDGGELAFGAVIFLRWTLNDGKFHCVPIIVKALVAPLKKKSIPRLELMGCLTLTRMYQSLLKALSFAKFEGFRRYFWCDSTTVLKWIKHPPRQFKSFVSARVAEIQECMDVKEFRYVSSKYNHADCLTRGVGISKLQRWLQGPDFLQLPQECWPDFRIESDVTNFDADDEIVRKEFRTAVENNISVVTVNSNSATKLCVGINSKNPILNKLLEKCSSFSKIRRFLVYLIRFGKYLAKRDYVKGTLTVSELKHAQYTLLKWVQSDCDDIKLSGISTSHDSTGIIRAHGRLENTRTLPLDQRNPIILPKWHKLVVLLIRHFHEKRAHCGHQSLMAEMRKSFWVIGLRAMTKFITKNCIVCKKLRKKPMGQIMGQIPEMRVAAGSPAFFNTATDMFGPINIKLGRKTKKEAQIVIFTCMTSRAIHLELVTNRTTDAFLMAYRRFSCLRGQPKSMFSDRGTNFIGAQSYLANLLKGMDVAKLKNIMAQEFSKNLEFEWKWNTPYASHMNGVVESLIRSVRQALNASCKMRDYTEEQWHTILAEVTYLINGRPLYPASNDIFDEPPVTPNDLLYGSHIVVPQPEKEGNINPRHLNRSVQTHVSEFWRCWLKYFPANLLPRNKWFKARENANIGDLVLEVNPNEKRGNWKMAIVQDIIKGADNNVRKVKIKTAQGIYERPIHKLCLIATKEELTS